MTASLVVFDCYGTLVDSHGHPHLPSAEAFAAELGRLGDDALEVAHEIRDALSGSLISAWGRQPSTVALLLEAHADCDSPLELADAREMAARPFTATLDAATLVPHTSSLLEALASEGHTLRVLSNCFAPGHAMEAMLERLGILRWFEACSWSSEIGYRKPEHRVFEQAGAGSFARRLMVGDSEKIDLEPARALGWEVVRAYRDGRHARVLQPA